MTMGKAWDAFFAFFTSLFSALQHGAEGINKLAIAGEEKAACIADSAIHDREVFKIEMRAKIAQLNEPKLITADQSAS
jgi:hypothetical protein